MRTITFQSLHRKKHFDFFRAMNHPHFNICANVDITNVLTFLKKEELQFTPFMVYLVSKVANEIPQFRWRIRGEEVVEHDAVHPSFTVHTDEADVFSFCEVEYETDFHSFYKKAIGKMAAMKANPSLEDHNHEDAYLFLSSIPWVSFTGFQHAMHAPPVDSVPRIVWGKYFKENDRIKMPLSVQAHHAVVDGRHVGRYFEMFEEFTKEGRLFRFVSDR